MMTYQLWPKTAALGYRQFFTTTHAFIIGPPPSFRPPVPSACLADADMSAR